MFNLIMSLLCRGVQPLLVKLGVQHGHHSYILAGSSVIWALITFFPAWRQWNRGSWDVDRIGIFCILALGGIAAIGSIFYFRAMDVLPASLVSLAVAAHPVVTLVGAAILFHEQLKLGQWLGVPFLAIGVFLLLFYQNPT